MRRWSGRLATTWVAVRRIALAGVLVALLLGVGNRSASSGPELPQLDVVVAVDVTTSMSALDDPSGSRITAVRRDLAELAERLAGARISVVTFGRTDRVLLPLTPDRAAVAEVARGLQVEEPTVGAGSSIGDAVPAILAQLERAAETSDRLPAVVVVTDGENTRPGRQRSFTGIGDRVGAALVLGYGSPDGGVMPVERVAVDDAPPTPATAGALVTDRLTGEAARSRLDDANLRNISDELGGRYVACDGSQDVAALAADLQAAARPDVDPTQPARDLRWLWALLVLLLVLPELRMGWQQFLDARREVRR